MDAYISEAVIRRLPRYYRKLEELKAQGVERVSSQELSRTLRLTASQVRQDFNRIDCFGQQGYGYAVEDLLRQMRITLGLTKPYHLVIIGAGNMGQALAQYRGFAQQGIHILALFDNDQERIGTVVGNRTILSHELLPEFVKNHQVEIGVIATPQEGAHQAAQQLIACGIRSLWNFAPVDMFYPGVTVENVALNDSLYALMFYMQRANPI